MRVLTLWGIATLLFLAVACDTAIDPPPGSEGGPCYGESEGCAAGLTCKGGTCKDLCANVTCTGVQTCDPDTGSCVTVSTSGPDVQSPGEDVVDMPDATEPEDTQTDTGSLDSVTPPEDVPAADEDVPNVDTSK